MFLCNYGPTHPIQVEEYTTSYAGIYMSDSSFGFKTVATIIIGVNKRVLKNYKTLKFTTNIALLIESSN